MCFTVVQYILPAGASTDYIQSMIVLKRTWALLHGDRRRDVTEINRSGCTRCWVVQHVYEL